MSAIGERRFSDAFGRQFSKDRQWQYHNKTILQGYVPLLGAKVAINRWQLIHYSRNKDQKEGTKSTEVGYRVGKAVRAIFEFLGLGILIGLFVDLPVTIVRSHREKSRTKSL